MQHSLPNYVYSQPLYPPTVACADYSAQSVVHEPIRLLSAPCNLVQYFHCILHGLVKPS
jgi:hypothetical protein